MYYNYRDNTDNNFLKNNYLNYNNKITFSYEQPDLMNNIFIILIWGNIIFNYFIFLPPWASKSRGINNEKNLYEKEDNKYNNEKDILYTKK